MTVTDHLGGKVSEFDAYPDNAHNISHAYQTMNDFNAERNLYTEERTAIVGRTRPGTFVQGQKVGMTHMYLQEKLDGELGHFKLTRRHDRIGYNQAMSPFIAVGGSHDDMISMRSGITSNNMPGHTTPPLLATIKSAQSLRGYNSAVNTNTNSHNNMHTASEKILPGTEGKTGGVSILSMQNGMKLPKTSRKAKGIAIQKILESTQKPWFMINGMEYNRPSPYVQVPNKTENTNFNSLQSAANAAATVARNSEPVIHRDD